MAKADAVGGSHKASHRRDLVRRSGNRRRVSVAVGESQKSSRMAKADAVGGSHKASQRRDLVRRSGNRRRVSVAVGESQKPSRMAKADAVGGQRGASERQRRRAKADAVGGQTPAHQTALRSQLAGLRSSQFPVRQMGPLPRSRLLTRIPDGRDRIGHISWSSTQTRDGSRVAATETAPTSPGGIES